MGDGATTSLRLHNINGRAATTSRADTELLIDAYSGEFAEFASAIQEHRSPVVGGGDALAAFAIAEAAIESMTTGGRAAVSHQESA